MATRRSLRASITEGSFSGEEARCHGNSGGDELGVGGQQRNLPRHWVGLPHIEEPGPPLGGCPASPPARSILTVCVQPELHGALVDGPRAGGQEGASSRDSL